MASPVRAGLLLPIFQLRRTGSFFPLSIPFSENYPSLLGKATRSAKQPSYSIHLSILASPLPELLSSEKEIRFGSS
ncbi:hypothetical protein WN943_026992 [Citrus x changshan-huyou]